MRLKKGFVLREVCGEHVITGEGLGALDFRKLLVLNETAVWLWQQAQQMETFSLDSLTERLCEAYDVTTDEARSDVSELLRQWQDAGLMELS